MVMLDHRLRGLYAISTFTSISLQRGRLTVQCYPDAGLGEADQTKYDGLERSPTVETAKSLSDAAMVRSYFFGSHGLKQHSLDSEET